MSTAVPLPMPTLSPPKRIAAAVVAIVAYVAAGLLGLAFAIPPGSASVVWPASGIAVAGLLSLGLRYWPAVWIAAWLVNLTTDVSWGLAAAFATGNTIEAVLAAGLLRWVRQGPWFRSAKDTFAFLAVAAVSCLPAATVGAGSMLLAGRIELVELLRNWSTWLLGDLAGVIIVVPLLLAAAARSWRSLSLARAGEFVLILALQVGLSLLIFGGVLSPGFARELLYLPMVLLIWCALRFGLLEVTASTLLFAAAGIWGTWAEVGAYGSSTVQSRLFELQALLLTYAMTSLAVTSLVSSQRRAWSSTRRSQAEVRRQAAERQRIERWFQQLLAASPDALIVSDAEGKILLVNEAAERLFGYEAGELAGQPLEILVPARYREMHREHRRRYARAPFVRLMGSGVELPACRKDGTEFPAEIALGPTTTDEGLLVFSAVRDVSSRKQAELALRDSQERFALAVEGTDAGIWDWDLRTDQVYFSPRWKTILGYQPDEITDDFQEWEERLHPADREYALRTVQAYLEGSADEYELEHRLRHKDGSYRWILARGAAVRDASGKPCRMVGSHLDITDRKEMEEQLRRQLAQLIAAEEIQSRLLPRVSPAIPGLDIAGRCFPAEFAAGDHFDFLFRKDGMFVPVIADVSGHGIGPAIMMASSHAYLRSLVEVHDDLAEVLARVNLILATEAPEERFQTLLAAVIDPRSKVLSYFRCGHPPGFVINEAGQLTFSMDEGTLPLGIVPEAEFPESASWQLRAGDTVVMLTDGILEAPSPEGEWFGLEQTLDTIRSHRHQSAREIIEAVRQAIRDFTGKNTLSDDITLIVIKVL